MRFKIKLMDREMIMVKSTHSKVLPKLKLRIV